MTLELANIGLDGGPAQEKVDAAARNLSRAVRFAGSSAQAEFGDAIAESLYPATVATVVVGPTGDFPLLSQALSYLQKRKRGLINGATSTNAYALARVLIQSTLSRIEEEIHLYNIDLGWIRIESEAPEVVIATEAIVTLPTIPKWRPNTRAAFIACYKSTLPQMAVLWRLDDSAPTLGKCGVIVKEGSFSHWLPGSGVKNAPWRGLYLDNGGAYGRGTVFTGCGLVEGVSLGAGIAVRNESTGNFREADLSGNANGLIAAGGSFNITDADVSGAVYDPESQYPTGFGVQLEYNSFGQGQNITADNCGQYAVGSGRGAQMVCDAISALNPGVAGLYSYERGSIISQAPVARGGPSAVLAINLGKVAITAGDLEASGITVNSRTGAEVDLSNGTIAESASSSVFRSQSGGVIRGRRSTLKVSGANHHASVLTDGDVDIVGCSFEVDGVSAARQISQTANVRTSSGLITAS